MTKTMLRTGTRPCQGEDGKVSKKPYHEPCSGGIQCYTRQGKLEEFTP
jgi:hypothetical protein